MKRSSMSASPAIATKRAADRAENDARARDRQLEEIARELERQAEAVDREQHGAQHADGGRASSSGRFENEDVVQADDDEHGDRHGARGNEPEVQHLRGEQVAGCDAEAGGGTGRNRETRNLA